MFTLFNDAIQQKKMQDQMEANAAMQQNLEARRVNPTMYEQPGNIVDFSNPASYMRGNAYNPYGYDNPFNNPNIQSLIEWYLFLQNQAYLIIHHFSSLVLLELSLIPHNH